MDPHLPPLASVCALSGRPFAAGERVTSFLLTSPSPTGGLTRHDVLETEQGGFSPPGVVACQWVQEFKSRQGEQNAARQLRLTAENLFLTLADPAAEPVPATRRLVQFLALLLERKKILRPKGRSADGNASLFEHVKSHQLFEVPAAELTPEFFLSIQEQLGALVGVS